jgi:hypothetical protein
MTVGAKLRYELWKEGTSYTFFPEDSDSARQLLEPGAVLIWSCEASSWEEAQTLKHEYLGFEPYKPMA